MKTTTPSECLTRLELFNKRIERLKANNYTLPRLRTQDLNALVFDMSGVKWWVSVGIFNKNQERAKKIINQAKSNWQYAVKLRDDHAWHRITIEQWTKENKGSYVSRSVYQAAKEENKKLLKDIEALVDIEDAGKCLEVTGRWMKHFADQKDFRNTLRTVCTKMILDNPEEYPDFLVQRAKENSKA
nr:hypothetical protein [uncultured Draconibacterium sp.]